MKEDKTFNKKLLSNENLNKSSRGKFAFVSRLY